MLSATSECGRSQFVYSPSKCVRLNLRHFVIMMCVILTSAILAKTVHGDPSARCNLVTGALISLAKDENENHISTGRGRITDIDYPAKDLRTIAQSESCRGSAD